MNTYQLSEHSDELALSSADEIVTHLTQFAAQARLSLRLFSPALDHALFNQQAFLDALRERICEHRRLHLKILLGNPQPSLTNGHRLVDLAGTLSTYIEIRRTHKQFQSLDCEYLLADEHGYLFRQHTESYRAQVCYNAPLSVDGYARQFTEIWESSTREREFLRLFI